MDLARMEADWWHTAAVVAKIHNVNVTKRSDVLTPREIHPMFAGEATEALRQFTAEERQRMRKRAYDIED